MAFLLWTFRKNYRFGPALIPKQISICLIGSILAIILWIYLLGIFTPDSHKIRSLEDLSSNFQFSQNIFASINSAWILRAINSTFLVPIFEELFCRIFLLEFFQGLSWPFKSVSHRIDQKPQFLSRPPLSWISVIATSTFFMVGHSLSAWPAAFIYFVLTCMIYKLTLSLRGCILVHAIANVAIAVFVIFFPSMGYLW